MPYARTVALMGTLSTLTAFLLVPATYTPATLSDGVVAELDAWMGHSARPSVTVTGMVGEPHEVVSGEESTLGVLGRATFVREVYASSVITLRHGIDELLLLPIAFLRGDERFALSSAVARVSGEASGDAATDAASEKGAVAARKNTDDSLFATIPNAWARAKEGPYWQSMHLEVSLILVRSLGLLAEGVLLLPVLGIWWWEANATRETRLRSLLNPFPWLWASGGSLLWLGVWVTGLMVLIPTTPVWLLSAMPPLMAGLLATMVSRFHQLR